MQTTQINELPKLASSGQVQSVTPYDYTNNYNTGEVLRMLVKFIQNSVTQNTNLMNTYSDQMAQRLTFSLQSAESAQKSGLDSATAEAITAGIGILAGAGAIGFGLKAFSTEKNVFKEIQKTNLSNETQSLSSDSGGITVGGNPSASAAGSSPPGSSIEMNEMTNVPQQQEIGQKFKTPAEVQKRLTEIEHDDKLGAKVRKMNMIMQSINTFGQPVGLGFSTPSKVAAANDQGISGAMRGFSDNTSSNIGITNSQVAGGEKNLEASAGGIQAQIQALQALSHVN